MSISASDVKSLIASAQDPDQARTLKTILDAFVDLLDGVQTHDLHGHTGLPQDRCEEIGDVKSAVFAAVDYTA